MRFDARGGRIGIRRGGAFGLSRFRVALGFAFIVAFAALYWLLEEKALIRDVLDPGSLKSRVLAFGPWGPLVVVGIMVLAVVISPLPSAPIAMAAGALYGHTWGTIYVLLGAEIGALAAFGIARLAGHELLRRWLGERLHLGWLGSQNALMGLVFVSRLLPFVSFDLVSYAAGLTVLSFWRFALATFVGIVPASFLLAHFGGELATGNALQSLIAALALSVLVVLPFAVKFLRDRLNARRTARTE
jgi:uncharacterized membrane protein YdjX (TVP38/TMEM64 family)